MKQLKLLILFALTLSVWQVKGQTYCSGTTPANCEMICNGGFETVTGTPSGANQLYYATGWTAVFNTPDLLSSSSPIATFENVPCNVNGYQYGHNNSNNYAGLYLNGYLTASSPYAWWEAITTNFSSPLAGKIYDVSFWVSAGDLGTVLNQNLFVDIGNFYTYTVSPSLLNDKNNWVLVTFPYCSTGGESSIIIRSAPDFTPIATTSQTTTGCTYTTTVGGSYIYLDDVSVKEAKFTIASATGCLNTPTNLNLISTCGIHTSNYTYVWNFGDGTSLVTTGTNTSHSYSNFGVYTGTVSVNANGCSNTYTFSVNVPNIGVSVTTNTTTVCNAITNFTATPSPSGSYTYSWSVQDAATNATIPMPAGSTGTNTAIAAINFANLYQNVNVCATITNTMGCKATQCYYIPSCCQTPTTVVKYSNYPFATNTTISTPSVSFGGTITINTGVTLTLLNTRAQMDPNTKFVINGTGQLIVTNSYLYGCNAMWNGIYPLSASTVSITNSRVEDAKRVVIDSLGGANIMFTNNYFNKNYMGTYFRATKTSASVVTFKNNLFTCSNIAPPVGTAFVPVTPNLTNAPTFGAYASVNLLPPYNTVKSYTGMFFLQASKTGATNTVITVGGNVTEENVFDKMQFGVYSSVSRTSFQNNVFQNINATIAPSGGVNVGILALGPIFGGSPGYTSVGGANSTFKNTFTNNNYGVYNLSQSMLFVNNNRFETQGTGIFVSSNNNNSSVNTSQNKFINNTIGINYDQNTNIIATINENWFENTTAQGTPATNFAIRCTEAVLATTANYTAYNNYIYGYYNGIYTRLTYQPSIRDNEVHMRPDATGANFQFGITASAANSVDMYNNIVDMPPGTPAQWNQNGIFAEGNTTPKIHCNNISNVGVSILANGLNYTTPGDGFRGNSMVNAIYGFWLNGSSEIGDQYYKPATTVYSADNTWAGCGNETYVGAGGNTFGGTGAKFYTRSTTPYNIANPSGLGNNLSGIVATGFTGPCYLGTSTPTLNLRVSGASAQAKLMQQADNIANGNVSLANTNLSHIARKQLYNHIGLQQIDPAVTPNINTFVNNNRNQPLGKFYVVDSLINTSDSSNYILAKTVNAGINATNDVDVTQQQFNSLYVTYLLNKRKTTATDISAFESIANLCPTWYGHAVYQARSVLFNTTKVAYINACEKNNASAHRIGETLAGSGDITHIKLFPNPSNGNITIETNDDLSYNLTVFNVLGEKLIDVTVANKQNINLNSLPSATYIVLINYNGSLVKTERINIIH